MTTAYNMRKFMNITEGKITKQSLTERRQKLKEFLQLILPALGILARGVAMLRASPAAKTALQTALNAAKAGSGRAATTGAAKGIGRLATLGGVAAGGVGLLSAVLSVFLGEGKLIAMIIGAAIQFLPEILSHFENHGQQDHLETVKNLNPQETIAICKKMLVQAGGGEEESQDIASTIVEDAFHRTKDHPSLVALAATKAIIDEFRDAS